MNDKIYFSYKNKISDPDSPKIITFKLLDLKLLTKIELFDSKIENIELQNEIIIQNYEELYLSKIAYLKQQLKIAEEKHIDLHLDLAWIVMSRDIEINLDHPCIKSFGIILQ